MTASSGAELSGLGPQPPVASVPCGRGWSDSGNERSLGLCLVSLVCVLVPGGGSLGACCLSPLSRGGRARSGPARGSSPVGWNSYCAFSGHCLCPVCVLSMDGRNTAFPFTTNVSAHTSAQACGRRHQDAALSDTCEQRCCLGTCPGPSLGNALAPPGTSSGWDRGPGKAGGKIAVN